MRLPKEERDAIDQMCELAGYLSQSHITKKNLKRLRELVGSPNAEIAEQANLILQVAHFKPYKKRRIKYLAEKHPDLLQKLRDTGLVLAHGY